MPMVVQAWPNRAACWSPAMPLIGAAMPPNAAGSVIEMSPVESTTRGRFAVETPKRSAISSLHAPCSMSNNKVRDAFDASVTWSRPADRRATSQLSTVPTAAFAAPSMFSIAHASFVAVK
jgi:hypothetical protein